MVEHWLPLALLAALAVAFVLVPLRRLKAGEAARELHIREEKNREVFAQRQLELEQEVKDGTVAAEDYQRLLAELQRAFLADMQSLQAVKTAPSTFAARLNWLPLALALLVPVAAGIIYFKKGAIDDLDLPAVMKSVDAAQDKEAQQAALDKVAATLAQRMQRRPQDLQNSYMLGTLYLGLDRFDDAIPVFKQMLTQMKPSPDRAAVLGQLAQAQYLKADNVMTPEVQATMSEAEALNPNERSVMGLHAVEAFLKRDFVTALKFWRRQLSDLQPGSEDAETLRQRIAAIENNLPEDQKAAAQGPKLSVVIDLAPELKAKLSEDMRLFVFARNPQMPMPIVAQNLALPDFPYTLTLDNSMSMTGMQLESSPQLLVGARLSKSGTAVAQSGDLQVLSAPFELKSQNGPLKLVINSVVP
ncbi:MAG TPA: c-type cytochrome biogenesis protein CcmI [Candidatus Acidoferrum sp.]|nr:c-type cytochrome biogenesis protein CcmI [Candidatus Acidoferrum sp.]